MFKTIKYGFGEGSRIIELIPYKSWQEREILLACSLNQKEFEDDGVEKIFNYLKDNIIYNKDYLLQKNEKIYLLYMLRSISVGETINTTNNCPHCSKNFNTELPIDGFITSPKIFNCTLSFGDFSCYFKDTYTESDIGEYFYKVVHNINKNEIILKDDIQNFFDNIDVENEDLILNFIKENRIFFNFFYKKKCPNCKEEFKIPMNSDTFVTSTLSEDSLISLYKTIANLNFHGKYTKTDVDGMLPFERSILVSLLETNLKELKEARP
jgi:hypothetical protein